MGESFHKSVPLSKAKDNGEENKKNENGNFTQVLYQDDKEEKDTGNTSNYAITEMKADDKPCLLQNSNDIEKQSGEEVDRRDIQNEAEQKNDFKIPYTDSPNIGKHTKEIIQAKKKSNTGYTIPTIKVSKLIPIRQIKTHHFIKNLLCTPSTSKGSVTKSDELDKDCLKFWDPKYINSLQAGIIESEINGNLPKADELKCKLEAARKYRKKIAEAGDEEEADDLKRFATTSTKNYGQFHLGLTQKKSEKRKADTTDTTVTTVSTTKHFANEEKYETVEQEKNDEKIDEEAQLGNAVGKNENPNAENQEDASLGDLSNTCDVFIVQEMEMDENFQKSRESCEFCINGKKVAKHLIVSRGKNIYMAVPAQKSLVDGQCYLTTNEHLTCVTAVDEEIWQEILVYRKRIVQFFESKNCDVVFYETAAKLYQYPHMMINCVPLPKTIGHMASIYFKKALLENQSGWSSNEKLIYLRRKDIRKGVPKRVPYFWVDFGMIPGFAHVIDDQRLFSKNFGGEVIKGVLRLQHSLWRKPQIQSIDNLKIKFLLFMNDWKPFEQSFQESNEIL